MFRDESYLLPPHNRSYATRHPIIFMLGTMGGAMGCMFGAMGADIGNPLKYPAMFGFNGTHSLLLMGVFTLGPL